MNANPIRVQPLSRSAEAKTLECQVCKNSAFNRKFSADELYHVTFGNTVTLCRECMYKLAANISEALKGRLDEPIYAIGLENFQYIVLECQYMRNINGQVELRAERTNLTATQITFRPEDEGIWFFKTREAAEQRIAELTKKGE